MDDVLVMEEGHRQRRASRTCSWCIERQRLTSKGEIVENTHISEVPH